MSRPPSSQTTPQFYRVSERDLTEIELHSVDSINDLHRTHPDHSHKVRPPRPAYTPPANGNAHLFDAAAINQTSQPISSWQKWVQDVTTPTSSRGYALSCSVIILLLFALLLIFYIIVQQGGALRSLTEAIREEKATAAELSSLIKELQTLRHNLTVLSRAS